MPEEIDIPKTFTVDNVASGPPAAGLLTKEHENGTLGDVNWKEPNNYKEPCTAFAVREAQQILHDFPDLSIKEKWIELEDICFTWRANQNCTIMEGQTCLPVQIKSHKNGFESYRLARDAECFSFMFADDNPIAKQYFYELGFQHFFAIMILYENHFNFADDLLGSYSSLKLYENHEMTPDAIRGKKVIDSARQGNIERYGTTDKRLERDIKIQEYINTLYTTNSCLSYSDLKAKAAKEFNLSTKTIDRATSNPKKH